MEQINKKISAIIIARNEEERIQTCLQGLKWTDERILINNNSTDKTVELSKKYNVTVIDCKTHDFSMLREEGLKKSRFEWVLYIDADEVVSESLGDEILNIINSFDPGISNIAYYIYRKNYYLGHLWPYKDKILRLFHRNEIRSWTGQLHETAQVQGKVGYLINPITHNTHRSLEEMVSKTNDWSEIEAMLRFTSDHPKIVWWRLLRVMLTSFYESFVRQGGWRCGTVGWIESIYQAFSIFITYAKLWELQIVSRL